MPFGLTNGSATFQRLTECILAGFTIEECLAYIDNIINFSATFEQHLGALKKSAAVTAGTGMSLKPSKGHFCKKK